MDTLENIKNSEYDAQLFGFTAEEFKVAFKCIVEEEVTRLTSSLASSLIKKYPEGEAETERIEEIRIALNKEYILKAEKPLHVLTTQLKELMHIPPHMLLPEDEVQRTQYSAEEEQELDDELKYMMQKIIRMKAEKLEWLLELRKLQDLLPDMEKRVEKLENKVAEQQKTEAVLESLETAIDKIADSTLTLLNLDHKLQSK